MSIQIDEAGPPLFLPADARAFVSSPRAVPPVEPDGGPEPLERLGPSPFPKSGFPFLGFLASVYDLISAAMPGGAIGRPATSHDGTPAEPESAPAPVADAEHPA